MIEELFGAIDKKNAIAFAEHLTDDCIFRFGNQQPVVGKAKVEEYVAAFFESILGIEHNIEDVWSADGAVVCHGLVTYTRRSGSELSVPFANVFKMSGRSIHEYLIFADTSDLYEE
ncbi:MAG: nuclear transport factor 2 family protein [Candidatus Thiodiazotropha sp.]